MSIEKHEPSHCPPEDPLVGLSGQPGEHVSWFADLMDLRVLVFLFSVIVIAMTATLLILSNGHQVLENTDSGLNDRAANATASSRTSMKGTRATKELPFNHAKTAAPVFSLRSVEQASDGSFVLPIGSADVSGCEVLPTGISRWQPGGSAQWNLEIRDRRTGFFYCHVTYMARFESQFAVQLGDRKPLKFTVYPHEADFTERFIVRLDKPEAPGLRLIAKHQENVAEVTITKVRLEPR